MPERSNPYTRRTIPEDGNFDRNPPSPFVELGLASCFSFLRGASDAVDLAQTAWSLGYNAIGIADRNTMAGVVRFHKEAKKACLRPLTGCRIALVTGEEFLAYPRDREAYGRLSRLLSRGKMRDVDGNWQAKGACDLTLDDLAAEAEGTILIAVPPADLEDFSRDLPKLVRHLPSLGHVAVVHLYRGRDRARINQLARLAGRLGLEILATNDVLYHEAARRPLQDVMTCIREKCTLAEAGYRLEQNAERYLKSPAEMQRLFGEWPNAIHASQAIADACRFDLEDLSYEYPREVMPRGMSPQAYLEKLTREGARQRYPDGVSPDIRALLDKELAMIEKLGIARYFLTIYDIVRFARHEASPPILCQGRGSAANSAVCFVLGITAVDPAEHELLFERFISEERREPPDIDVDFEHERREEVIQHIYAKYGRDRAGLCATVVHYRPRSAIREVGKVMGLGEDVTGMLARTVWGQQSRQVKGKHAAEAGLDLSDSLLRKTIALTRQLIGMPRHLGQHVGGFILTERPLTETVPIGNGAMPERSFIEWDKDDIETLGIFKVDILALGMLTCIRKSFELIRNHWGQEYSMFTVPREDPRVYDMLCRADSIGVFQVESRAQMNMLPRLRPRHFYDLVVEIAIVRPGPIQGDMVHPYLRRRGGEETVEYPAPGPPHDPLELKKILSRTLGVPIFQEQAMKIAIEAARFTSAEANELRKAMATFRSRGTIGKLEEKMVGRMVARGYDPDFARRCFNQIKGFGEYGFPESHAASFAHLVYLSSWIKCHFPEVFCAALLNSQPMGFYAPAQIVRDAREHGVEIRAPDVNFSEWDNTLEPSGAGGFAVRLGFRQIGGLQERVARRILHRRNRAYGNIEELQVRTELSAAVIRRLAAADAFRSLFIDRRQALWEAEALDEAPALPVFGEMLQLEDGASVPLPVMPVCEQVIADYQTLRLSLKAHPMSFLRKSLETQGYITTRALQQSGNRSRARIAGLVLVRQRPGTAKGVCFITLEDELGVANLVVWPNVMEQYRPAVMQSRLLSVEGYVQRDADIIHLVAEHLEDRSDALARLVKTTPLPEPSGKAGSPPRLKAVTLRHPRNMQVVPRSRDFH